MKIVAGNAQHIGSRPEQQDSFGFSDPRDEKFVSHGGFLGVVADGMGGLSHGSEASRAAVRTFLLAYESKGPDEPIPDALSRALNAANQAVMDLADRFESRNGTGTTLVAAVWHGDALHWISAGDSRAYLCRGSGLTRVTSDHVFARKLDEDVAKGTISRAEAEVHAERGALTSYLGDLKAIDRSVRPFLLRKGDRVFLCSDGFYRALSEGEITEAFRGDPQTACDVLVARAVAKQRRNQDNLTVITLSDVAGAARRRELLRTAVLGFMALMLLAAVGGAIYARSWWIRHQAGAASHVVPASQRNGANVPSAGGNTSTPQSPSPAGPNLQSAGGTGHSTASGAGQSGNQKQGPGAGKSVGNHKAAPSEGSRTANAAGEQPSRTGQSQASQGQTDREQSSTGTTAGSGQPPASSVREAPGSTQQSTAPGQAPTNSGQQSPGPEQQPAPSGQPTSSGQPPDASASPPDHPTSTTPGDPGAVPPSPPPVPEGNR